MTDLLTITIVYTCTGHLLSYLPCGCLSQQTHKKGNDSLLTKIWLVVGVQTTWLISFHYITVTFSALVYTVSTLVLIYWLFLKADEISSVSSLIIRTITSMAFRKWCQLLVNYIKTLVLSNLIISLDKFNNTLWCTGILHQFSELLSNYWTI